MSILRLPFFANIVPTSNAIWVPSVTHLAGGSRIGLPSYALAQLSVLCSVTLGCSDPETTANVNRGCFGPFLKDCSGKLVSSVIKQEQSGYQ